MTRKNCVCLLPDDALEIIHKSMYLGREGYHNPSKDPRSFNEQRLKMLNNLRKSFKNKCLDEFIKNATELSNIEDTLWIQTEPLPEFEPYDWESVDKFAKTGPNVYLNVKRRELFKEQDVLLEKMCYLTYLKKYRK